MKTVMAKFTDKSVLLIEGVKGKISEQGEIRYSKTQQDLQGFIEAFKTLINTPTTNINLQQPH